MSSTAARRRLVRRLLQERPVANQSELVDLLAAHDHHVTQATVSRDLAAVGAVKTDGEGYVLGQPVLEPAVVALGRVLEEFVDTIRVGGNLVVLKTPPGAAHIVASAVDHSRLDGVMGTVAGDDTLFIATENTRMAANLKKRLELIGEMR